MHRERDQKISARRPDRGFTLIEVMIVVGIIAVIAGAAIPTMLGGTADERLKSSVRDIGGAFQLARSEAIRTGQIHIVFVGTQANGTALPDINGNPALAVILNDGLPGSVNQNCAITAGERIWKIEAEQGIAGGVLTGVTAMVEDGGVGSISTGSSFTQPDGSTAASWVLFRPEGTAHAFNSSCTIGDVGSGAGAIYLNNGRKQFGISLRPLGNSRVRVWDRGATQWAG